VRDRNWATRRFACWSKTNRHASWKS